MYKMPAVGQQKIEAHLFSTSVEVAGWHIRTGLTYVQAHNMSIHTSHAHEGFVLAKSWVCQLSGRLEHCSLHMIAVLQICLLALHGIPDANLKLGDAININVKMAVS